MKQMMMISYDILTVMSIIMISIPSLAFITLEIEIKRGTQIVQIAIINYDISTNHNHPSLPQAG